MRGNDVSACSRRSMLQGLAAAALAGPAWAEDKPARRIKQSACLWCYNGFMKRENMDLDAFAAACAKMGVQSIELIGPDQWPAVRKHGLICAMTPSHGIAKGINRTENHEACLGAIRRSIDATAEAGFPNVITLSGNREGLDDQQGLENAVAALKQVAGYAEQKKVTICLEFLNSHDHKDYMADSTAWCVELVHRVGSPRVKVLYDIYHAAMMKEDVLADIQKHADCWGHYHTGGMPGRHEIDETQTLDYPKLMRAILATGFDGYVGQEFVPKNADALASLRAAVARCDVS